MVQLPTSHHSDDLSDGTEYGMKRGCDVTKRAESEQTSAMSELDADTQLDLVSESDKEHIRRIKMLPSRLCGIDALIGGLNPRDLVKQIRQSIYALTKKA